MARSFMAVSIKTHVLTPCTTKHSYLCTKLFQQTLADKPSNSSSDHCHASVLILPLKFLLICVGLNIFYLCIK